MKTQPETPSALADLWLINGALAFSTQQCIESMTNPDPKQRRGVDFQCIDGALAAAEKLVAELGPDVIVPAAGPFRGSSAAHLLICVRNVAASAAPYRPAKERRA